MMIIITPKTETTTIIKIKKTSNYKIKLKKVIVDVAELSTLVNYQRKV